MATLHIIPAVGISLVVPLIGVIMFVLLCRWMRRLRTESPPIMAYFILFTVFGGWLMVLLTVLFWKWSGMASLGILYLMVVAPFLTAASAFELHEQNRRKLTSFHRSAFVLNVGYTVMMFIVVLFLVLGSSQ
jgi:hypothetical protein